MRIAITGGTGFVGRHLAESLAADGHEVIIIARGQDRRDPAIISNSHVTFAPADLSRVEELTRAFSACGTVAHFAGINREIGSQTYNRVHVRGTQNVVEAARRAGVGKMILLSFLRARPNCGSAYHESKWAAEEIVRSSGFDYTIFKSGMIYGRGDHMLDHLSHAISFFPVFALVGFKPTPIRPLAVEEIVRLSRAAILENRLSRKTVATIGPELLTLNEAARRVARVLGKKRVYIRAPLLVHRAIAWIAAAVMKVPLVSKAQLRILSEGVVEPLPPCDFPPEDLAPRLGFTDEQIRRGLPAPGGFGFRDLRWF